MNCGFYQVKIWGRTYSPLLSWWSERLNSFGPQRCPKLMTVKLQSSKAKAAMKPCNARVNSSYILSDNDGQDLLHLYGNSQQIVAPLNKVGESDISTASNSFSGDLADPVRALRHNRQLQCNNKHLKHDPQSNKTTLCCGLALLIHLLSITQFPRLL